MALLALCVSCQRVDLPEELPTELPTCAIGSKATITFSIADLMNEQTKSVINPSIDVKTLHLIVFDENGMLTEVCPATNLGSSDHGDHSGGKLYTVTLTVTDQRRYIHFVANCPVKQIVYGHEASIIGNLFVDKNIWEHETVYETAFWARIEVDHILVNETQDENGNTVVSLDSSIADKFKHVPLLRNYAEITVTDQTKDNKFKFLGYTVYNLLDKGSVAPYNSNTQQFQDFFKYTGIGSDGVKTLHTYSYPELTGSPFRYEGHALSSAQLITDFVRDENGAVKIYGSNDPFYIYERKVSVMTDEEEKWRESPPHIIIKGRYNHGDPVTDNSPIYYYKMDLVYTEKDANGNEEIKYYNILRNFMYQFNLEAVHDEGYPTLAEAVAGAAGNNISGSSSTSKLTNVSDNEGRLWVSYTDTTLVTNNAVTLKYKYIPNYYDSTKGDYQQVKNDQVRFENIVGDVISRIEIAESDITGNGQWAGYRNVTVYVKDPEAITHQQALQLKTNSAHLNRQIRYTMREKLNMEVECTPKVAKVAMQPVTVDIKLPTGLTDDMFPIVLNMETYDRTLSPDASKNTIPVTSGISIIDADGRRGERSYYYTVTIPTLEDYRSLPHVGNMRVYSTYWITSKADNASTIYVDNKYFNQASDSWTNYQYDFSNVSCSTAELGANKDVSISFTMDADDNKYNTRKINISLVGMTYNGASSFEYTPTSRNVTIEGLKTSTSDGPVSFTLNEPEYDYASAEASRLLYQFHGTFKNVTRLNVEANVVVDFEFNIPANAYHEDMVVAVTLDRLMPADDKLVYSQLRAEGDKYLYYVHEAGTQTIKLATTDATAGTCTVTLEADHFHTDEVSVAQTDVMYEFGARFKTEGPISVKSDVRVEFNIPEEAYKSGMKVVKVTLDRLVPNNDANLKSVGNGVYEYTVPGAGLQEMKLLADKNEAGQCAVTLEAGKYYFTTETIKISQVQVSLEPQLTVIWKNTDNREVSWNGIYRFGLDGRDGNNECIETFSQDVWNVIKNGTFYIKFRPTNSNFNEFNMRITTGHWQRTWRGSDITSGNNLIKNNGDGTYYIEINFSGDEILNLLDAQHLLFTGSHYTPIELYCYM